MVITTNIKKTICSLFEVHEDSQGTQRIVTPLEYLHSNEKIVIRVRPSKDGDGFFIDENGEAAFTASMNGGDVESEIIQRWAEDLCLTSPVEFTGDETLQAFAHDERLIAPYIFKVAEAAQQLNAFASHRHERKESQFKEQVGEVISDIAKRLQIHHSVDTELPIMGGLVADHILGDETPLIVIVATSATRLLEAEVIYMQYKADRKPGKIIAIAESQASVGKKQYERANYYTDKSLIFNPDALSSLITQEMRH
ncbi:hypothetical protein ACKF11_08990 [Methylobacillus sp. Pita2]|uniref:hypothetical protein n=1 Tax=Methylobacillus sp. Pita2 TaxID=3383245 RepID=UPI0038B4317A